MKLLVTTALGADLLHMKPGTDFLELKEMIAGGHISWIEDRNGLCIQISQIISMQEAKD